MKKETSNPANLFERKSEGFSLENLCKDVKAGQGIGAYLIKGDALKVLPEIPDDAVDLAIVDPPYNVLRSKNGYTRVEWDEFGTVEEFSDFTTTYLKELERVVKKNGSIFVFWGEKHFFLFQDVLKSTNLRCYKVVIWHYPNLIKGACNTRWVNTFDFIFHLVKGDKPYAFNAKFSKGENRDVWIFTKPQTNFKGDKKVHPAQKPVSLYRRLIKMFSNEGDVILDPFAGSGTSLIAAIDMKRNCIAVERNEEFVKLTVERVKELLKNREQDKQAKLFGFCFEEAFSGSVRFDVVDFDEIKKNRSNLKQSNVRTKMKV